MILSIIGKSCCSNHVPILWRRCIYFRLSEFAPLQVISVINLFSFFIKRAGPVYNPLYRFLLCPKIMRLYIIFVHSWLNCIKMMQMGNFSNCTDGIIFLFYCWYYITIGRKSILKHVKQIIYWSIHLSTYIFAHMMIYLSIH